MACMAIDSAPVSAAPPSNDVIIPGNAGALIDSAPVSAAHPDTQHVQEPQPMIEDCAMRNADEQEDGAMTNADEQEDRAMIVAVDVEEDAKDPSEPPEPKRRRLRRKLPDREYHSARGLQYLIPRPLRLPLIMAAIISAMMAMWPRALDDPLDAVEIFSGVKSIVKGFERLGMKAVGFDKADDDRQDLSKPWGMVDLMHRIRRVRVHGLLPWATPCSTWVTVNRGTSQRSPHNPLGHQLHDSVSEANVCVARMALLMIWSVVLGLQWLLEQPQSSLMSEEPRFHDFLRCITHYKIPTCMGAYGKETMKGTTLLGSSRWMAGLHRTSADIPVERRSAMTEASKKVSKTTVDARGRKRFTGLPGHKGTQSYTLEYGLEVATLYMKNKKPEVIDLDAINGGPHHLEQYDAGDLWEDARLDEVFSYAPFLLGSHSLLEHVQCLMCRFGSLEWAPWFKKGLWYALIFGHTFGITLIVFGWIRCTLKPFVLFCCLPKS